VLGFFVDMWKAVILLLCMAPLESQNIPSRGVDVTNATLQSVTTPIPGYCKDKDDVPVDLDLFWKDSCKDKEGNSYPRGSLFMSCCGCFRYTCTVSQETPASFNWTKSVAPTCCQTCNGTVVKEGTVVATELLGDTCSTVRTTICKIKMRRETQGQADVDTTKHVDDRDDHNTIQGQIPTAALEEEFDYTKCCIDETGTHLPSTVKQEPSTCSTRTCEASTGWAHAAWVTRQILSGCGCCVINGTFVPNGFTWKSKTDPAELWVCCSGKMLLAKDQPTTTSTTSTPTTTITTASGPRISDCSRWQNASGDSLYSMAVGPNRIGDLTNNKRCYISDAKECARCACDYYVRYSEDGGLSWLTLTWGGVPGGTGCPGYGKTSATKADAIAWLQDKHIDMGRCGCKP